MNTNKRKDNKNLRESRENKNDEFYTKLESIDEELKYYKPHFKEKTVLCNCNDLSHQKFLIYFSREFKSLKLKSIIFTQYKKDGRGRSCESFMKGPNWWEIEHNNVNFKGDGDFRSLECVELLKKADIVVTNPPFSLFREFISYLRVYQKKFLVIGSENFIPCKEIFPLLRDNKIWLGKTKVNSFVMPNGEEKEFGNVCWFTNLEYEGRFKDVPLTKKYEEHEYPKYDNLDAIDVSKVKDIPLDYKGIMGVPVSFLYNHNPKQFKVLGKSNHSYVNRVRKYIRIFIKRI